jgi:hypothetical protein
MSLTCGYSSPRSDGDANSQVTGARVQVPLGHEPLGHDAMLPALRLTGPRRADLNKLPNLRCLLTAELAARRCRTAGSGAFSRRVWCCAEPARLGVNVAGLLRRRFFGACLAAAVPAGQGSLRVVRAGRLVRTGPDRPEGPRPSGPDPRPPVEPQARQEAICEQDEDKPIGLSENARRSGRLFCGEEGLRTRRGRPATGSGESVIPADTACALPGRRRAGGQVRCEPLLEDECGTQPGYLENLP